MKKIIVYLNRQYLFLFLMLISLQQIFMGISTYYLGYIPQEILNKNVLILCLLIYLFATLIYFALVILIRKIEISNQALIYENIFHSFLNKYKGLPSIWIQKKQKESFQVSIGYKLFQSVSGLFSSSTEIFRYTLGFLIESIAISLVLEVEFLFAIFFSILFSFLVTLWSQNTLEKLSNKNSRTENKFFSYLTFSWDYLFLKNEQLQNQYSTRVGLKYSLMTKNLNKMYTTSEIIVFLNALVVLLPLIAFDLYMILSDSVPQSKIFALIPLIPRQMSIANNVRAFSQMVTFFKIDLAGFKMNLHILEIEEFNLSEKIDLSKLDIKGSKNDGPFNFEKLLVEFQNKKSGRYTITGKNGAGKSMFLLKLHENLEKSVYLPATLPLISKSLSTGQAHRNSFENFLKFDSNFYLFDEWDANLDANAIQELNMKLDHLSKTAVVIEVRHLNSTH